MAENTPPKLTTPPVKEVLKVDKWQEADNKVAAIEDHIKEFAGKEGHNVYKWQSKNDWKSIVEGVKKRDEKVLDKLSKIDAVPNTKVEGAGPVVKTDKEIVKELSPKKD